jgi:N-dimethylarginine dimethylaminohydrolase
MASTIQSMTAPLRQVLVCPPSHAGWNDPKKSTAWQELGFHHPPVFAAAQDAHEKLCELLALAGAEVLTLPTTPGLTLDAVYTHDASLPTNHGLIKMRPGKTNRVPEAQAQSEFLSQQSQPLSRRDAASRVSAAIPTLGETTIPATTEAGDILWLDPHTLLVGQGYRTNKPGIDQLRAILSPHRVEVIPAPLPYGEGPAACLHLMSLMSMLNEQTILVDLPWLSVETVELLRARNFRLIGIDQSERETQACNVLALGNNQLIAIEENAKTNTLLKKAGFEVATIPGKELCLNGNGGPTCLTRPTLRH